MPFWIVFFILLVPLNAFSAIERQSCGALSEPSGVVSLLDGRFLVVEDEKNKPIRLLSHTGAHSFLSNDTALGTLADLEGVAQDKQGFVYVITSHSRTKDGKRSKTREKLVRFRVDGQRVRDVTVVSHLRKEMVSLSKALKTAGKEQDVKQNSGFNIEGLSFDQDKKQLLIGLRSPVVNQKAVILVLKNPKAIFEQGARPHFKKTPIYLDLDKGGIRSITFDPYLNGYLIVSRYEKKGKKFKLWWWSGNESEQPHRVRINGKLNLSNAEGITSVRDRGGKKLMIVFDVGNSSKRANGCYVFLDYSQIKIEGGTN
ncbi:MAG: DUF3616 domain-containing protein [Thiomicrorhabdus sp.]|nr:DUF3616 domain-containing protein [Thiomicrorhabdus sp.]